MNQLVKLSSIYFFGVGEGGDWGKRGVGRGKEGKRKKRGENF